MKTLKTREYAHRVRSGLQWALAIVVVVGLIATLLLPGRPISSALIGIAAATVIIEMSAFSISKMVDSDDLGIGWVIADYLIKIAAIALAILIPKSVGGFNLPVIAAIVVASIVVTLVIQLRSMQVKLEES